MAKKKKKDKFEEGETVDLNGSELAELVSETSTPFVRVVKAVHASDRETVIGVVGGVLAGMLLTCEKPEDAMGLLDSIHKYASQCLKRRKKEGKGKLELSEYNEKL